MIKDSNDRVHIDHNVLDSNLCRESTKRVLNKLELLQQKELSKIPSIKRLLLFRNNKVSKDNIFDTLRVCFQALII
jgi:hypothetical protein